MRNTKVLLLFLLAPFSIIKGQTFTKPDNYLSLPGISKAAKDYYSGKFKASDDSKTLSILDSLRTRNSATRPFYLYLIARLSEKTDGALSESLGLTLKEFLEKSPNDFIAFLNSKEFPNSQSTSIKWADLIAGEFMISCENTVKKCVSKSLNSTLIKTNADHQKDLRAFYALVAKYCH